MRHRVLPQQVRHVGNVVLTDCSTYGSEHAGAACKCSCSTFRGAPGCIMQPCSWLHHACCLSWLRLDCLQP
jgi:hypothetical protein